MMTLRSILTAFVLLAATAPAGIGSEPTRPRTDLPGATRVSESAMAAPSEPSWSEVRLSVRRFLFLSGELAMSRRRAVYEGAGPFRGKTLILIRTRGGAYGFGRSATTETWSWIDPATGGTVEYRELKHGKRLKLLLFGPEGYRERVHRPDSGRDDAPPERWPRTADAFRPYRLKDGGAVPDRQPVRDYYNMIADLGRLDRRNRDVADYYVAMKGRVIRFQVAFEETTARKLRLTDLADGGKVKMSLRLRRMNLRPVHEEPGDVGGFFAMEGGTEIWLEESTGIVAVIAGKVPRVPGRTEILLRGARFDGRSLREALRTSVASLPPH